MHARESDVSVAKASKRTVHAALIQTNALRINSACELDEKWARDI